MCLFTLLGKDLIELQATATLMPSQSTHADSMLVSLEPFKTWDQDYPVQDLRGMNWWVDTVCLAVPSPFLFSAPASCLGFIPVLELKDAFFFPIPLSKLNASLHLNGLTLTWT